MPNISYGGGPVAGEISIKDGVGGASSIVKGDIDNWDTAYGWGDHAGLYDPIGEAASEVASHESTYNHSNYNDAYTHVSSTGADHSYIDQDVRSSASPQHENLGLGHAHSEARLDILEDDTDEFFQIVTRNTKLGGYSGKSRFGNRQSNTYISTNYSQTGGAGAQDDATDPSWVINISSNEDAIFITRSPAGSTSLSVLAKIGNGGSLYLKEQAAATGDASGLGQIWVKNTSPTELWFTDDGGTDHQIAYV